MKKTFSVGGMSCSACSIGIEKGVGGLSGVTAVAVSLLDKTMTVDFDENLISEREIFAFVTKLGYTVGEEATAKKNSDAKILRNRFLFSLIALLPLMYLCLGGAVGAPVFYDNRINFTLQMALALIIIVINRKFYINGVKAVIHRAPNMDTLVSLGSISAFTYSVVMTVLLFTGTANPHHVFFDGSAMVLALVTLGKWLEELSKIKTGSALEKLSKLIPDTLTQIVDGKEKYVLTSEIKAGDLIAVKAGEYVAVDGIIVEGNASVDKSAITGESMPEEVAVGARITSGSIVTDGYVVVRAESVGNDTLFAKIIQTVKQAGASKAPIQKFADRVSGVFVPIVTALALITFVVWIAVTGDLYASFNFGISVLVISCPCALGLATPVAVVASMGASAKRGVLFKNAESLQSLCKVNLMLLDKTATLTVGKPKVTDFVNLTNEDVSPAISALEQKSSHPLAKCISEYCGETDEIVTEYEYVLGKGIIGKIGEDIYRIGNAELVAETAEIHENYLPEKFLGKTVIYASKNGVLVCVFALADYLKEDAERAVNDLQNSGIQTVMITGDNAETAKSIAEKVGITEFKANVFPQDKFEVVESYKEKGFFVAMVGDGINDSPALKSADVGVAMGNGSDVAIDSADVVLMSGNLDALNDAIRISKKSLRVIKENLFWAFLYNVIGIPVAAGALSMVGVTLTPIIASACMCVSSLCVVLNALRLSVSKRKKKVKGEIMTLKIKNMMCKHCEAKVTEILLHTAGVSNIKINLKKKTATFDVDGDFDKTALIGALKQADFDAE